MLRRATLLIALASVVGCHHHKKYANAPNGAPASTDTSQQPAAPPPLAATDSGAQLTRVTADNQDETTPQLSPDGKVVIFVAWSAVDDGQGNMVPQTTVMGADPSNGAARTLYTNTNAGANWPTFAPNGSLVYASMSTGTQTLVKSLTNAPNAAFTVINDGRTAPSPSWPAVSPDGRHLAFEATINNNENIVTSGMDGSKVTILGPGYTPSWSPDGKRLAFSRVVGQGAEIMLIDAANGGNLTQVTNAGCSSNKPRFSPDGRYLVFESNCGWNQVVGGTANTTWNIFAVKTDGSGLTQLTQGPGESGQPFWGKDGFIYFESNYGGTNNRDIWRLQPTGDLAGPAVQITPAPAKAAPNLPPPGVPLKNTGATSPKAGAGGTGSPGAASSAKPGGKGSAPNW